MFLYIAAHAQAGENTETLSALGKKQARLLGEHLKARAFSGRILAATAQCVTETARIVASVTGAALVAFPLLDPIDTEEGKRTAVRAYKSAMATYPDSDLLILTDAAGCDALLDIFVSARPLNARQYDCALSTLRPTHYFTPVLYDASFLSYEETTLGSLSREACDVAYMQGEYKKEIALPDLSRFTGERILHIGDTESASYPYYRRLIDLVRPDVILHTGDLADEVKIGRHPEYLHEYTVKIGVLLDIMKKSGARVIIVPGNHDVADKIRELAPYAEICEKGSEVVISGILCRVGHQVKEMVFDRRYCMYGHGMAGEIWRDALNLPGEPCRFNVAFGDYIYDLENDRYVRLAPVRGLLE